MYLYVDESGSITSSKDYKNRYFVIAFLETAEPYNVIRQFKRAKKDYIKRNPKSKLDIKNEIKGSEMPYGMKKTIFERLRDKTDAQFHFKIIDNFSLKPELISQPALSFNYFVYLTVENIYQLHNINNDELKMLIDERNVAVGSLKSLEDYLKVKFIIESKRCTKVQAKYKDSSSKDLIQIIDLYCNTVYRIAKNSSCSNLDKKNRVLLSLCNRGCSHFFPKKNNTLDICT